MPEMLHTHEHPNVCFNCEDPHVYGKFFCVDCWRMAIITTVFSGFLTEMVHRVAQQFFGGAGIGQ